MFRSSRLRSASSSCPLSDQRPDIVLARGRLVGGEGILCAGPGPNWKEDRAVAVADCGLDQPVLVRIDIVVAKMPYYPLVGDRFRFDRDELEGHRIELSQGDSTANGLGAVASAQRDHHIAATRVPRRLDLVDGLEPHLALCERRPAGLHRHAPEGLPIGAQIAAECTVMQHASQSAKKPRGGVPEYGTMSSKTRTCDARSFSIGGGDRCIGIVTVRSSMAWDRFASSCCTFAGIGIDLFSTRPASIPRRPTQYRRQFHQMPVGNVRQVGDPLPDLLEYLPRPGHIRQVGALRFLGGQSSITASCIRFRLVTSARLAIPSLISPSIGGALAASVRLAIPSLTSSSICRDLASSVRLARLVSWAVSPL